MMNFNSADGTEIAPVPTPEPIRVHFDRFSSAMVVSDTRLGQRRCPLGGSASQATQPPWTTLPSSRPKNDQDAFGIGLPTRRECADTVLQ